MEQQLSHPLDPVSEQIIKDIIKRYIAENPTTPTAVSYSKVRAHVTGGHQIALSDVPTKCQLAHEDYDTLEEFNTANYRFTATTAGYYLITGVVTIDTGVYTADDTFTIYIYKDGASYSLLRQIISDNNIDVSLEITDIIYLAATNYIELYASQSDAVASGEIKADETFLAITRLPID